MAIDTDLAVAIGRRHGLGLTECAALAAMSTDTAEAETLAATFANNVDRSMDQAIRQAAHESTPGVT